jgi:hypothetical protein
MLTTSLRSAVVLLVTMGGAAMADGLKPPTVPEEWPTSKVKCATYRDLGSGQRHHNCVQVWYNNTERCYYNATMELVGGTWHVRSKALVRFPLSDGAPRCDVDTHAVVR